MRQHMEARGAGLEGVGVPYLFSLFDTVSSAADAPCWIGKVRETAQLRSVWEWTHRTQHALQGGVPDPAAFLRRMQGDLDRIAQTAPSSSDRRKPLAERTVDLADV